MSIDWEQQWREFAPAFYDGVAHIPLPESGKTLLLKPGAGFGDFSHPTTRLTLEMLHPHLRGSTLIDIGCGSGILSIAGALLGAKKVIGIDIEESAVDHARENALLNGVEGQVHFSKSLDGAILDGPLVIALNMIRSEQIEAWESLPILHQMPALVISSGILISERDLYLSLVRKWGWTPLYTRGEGEWLALTSRILTP
ncbi:MAG: 50S ribosomal protein L11 methyltransferase [Verrucomicrobia bacterium]|nr:50S ribosomal protein L11 methyltransferase [Verrucomicrobiota bacterium]